ncbi:hypothetical protein CC80DRAFT_280663 [Byssothecium circinans]|uniref:Uncharacterized protein n=1 Tax=Byssothecium circinans TaxID=147558 RepID=A0A6A5T7X2_9PLEO|nr:hypothetical protein CC80DRAFT_280663 [Byssothecium circinans]
MSDPSFIRLFLPCNRAASSETLTLHYPNTLLRIEHSKPLNCRHVDARLSITVPKRTARSRRKPPTPCLPSPLRCECDHPAPACRLQRHSRAFPSPSSHDPPPLSCTEAETRSIPATEYKTPGRLKLSYCPGQPYISAYQFRLLIALINWVTFPVDLHSAFRIPHPVALFPLSHASFLVPGPCHPPQVRSFAVTCVACAHAKNCGCFTAR